MTPAAPMPVSWRFVLFGVVAGLTAGAYATQSAIGPRGQAAFGVVLTKKTV